MFRSLSKLGIALTVVFVVSLVALLLELFYVLWRRHRLHRLRRIPTATATDDNHNSPPLRSSKEQLLYFFCLKTNLSRVEPNSAASINSTLPSPEDEAQTEEIDVLKLCYMRGPSRVLYTIEEEEREGVESAERSLCASAEKEKKTKRLSLQECFESSQEPPPLEVAVSIDDDAYLDDVVDKTTPSSVVDTTTPFSTPCSSPSYFFTPSATPTRELADEAVMQNGKR